MQLFRNTTEEWYHVRVNGEEIVCTGGHPFYILNADNSRNILEFEGVKSKGTGKWICARDLKKSDKVLLSDGSCAIIEEIQVEQLETPETTYNFEVADYHTYYVSDSKVLVHNACKYYEATRTKDGIVRGREITKKQALNRVRNGKDVLTNSRSSAKALAKKAFGNSKVYSEIHDNLYNAMAHFHDSKNHIYHIFYGNNFI